MDETPQTEGAFRSHKPTLLALQRMIARGRLDHGGLLNGIVGIVLDTDSYRVALEEARRAFDASIPPDATRFTINTANGGTIITRQS